MTNNDNPLPMTTDAAGPAPLFDRACNNERDMPAPAGHAPRLTYRVEGDRLRLSDGEGWIESGEAWDVVR